ncbi:MULTISPECIES: AbrB/MazE/SpoVT family DNA-binding domain-containing protein [Vibrio]|uniref:AbrB/MazE/SpoVT family DNA-binding domain-containing protein n=1 Tax=Vibrio TaxID=662 RepID=UPI001BD2D631|nr:MULTISPECIES: AbrB/MazE/SpoVT family DNA-binding domain-containing protein [Vibrio]MBT0110604.1 AbrB/MazE/SpoVT family DNA-binding domain-containing protein [Vibrio alginolyticus]MDW2193977.1 AbrB/MazE/SpoVT family DNA-binding domain-containing protein [Vibrio sp. 1641]MDW2328397.1 AbrB/MazE/SpoVT family DNA-binding domain-containing protein [Vibrio sp. 1401]
MSVAIARWGNSAAVRIPKEVMAKLALNIGDAMNIDVDVKGEKIVIEPSKPSLESLLSMITDDNRHQELLNDMKGNEII